MDPGSASSLRLSAIALTSEPWRADTDFDPTVHTLVTGPLCGVTTEEDCLRALEAAADRLGESPTKAAYEESGIAPSSTIVRVMGRWNAAKEAAGLETFTQAEGGGHKFSPSPTGSICRMITNGPNSIHSSVGITQTESPGSP